MILIYFIEKRSKIQFYLNQKGFLNFNYYTHNNLVQNSDLSKMKLSKIPIAIRKFSTIQIKQQRTESILLTGLQPTGSLHLGNYFGSILNVLKYQQNSSFSKRFLFIADLHSLTTAFTTQHDSLVYNSSIGQDSFSMVRTLLACGIKPQITTLFIQSHIPEHSELSWILSCFTNQHALNFMIQYKEKANQSSSVGLYTYPLLMASDILLYRSTHVPVGVDQVQHLQLTNKICERFNKVVKEKYFPKVQYVEAQKAKIMSLTNPDKKMSKSDNNERSRINLNDSSKTVQQKIRRAVTDSEGNLISYEPEKRAGLSNLIELYSILKKITKEQVVIKANQNKWSIGDLKNELTIQICRVLDEIKEKMKSLDDISVKRVIEQGADKARSDASKNIKEIKRLLKLF